MEEKMETSSETSGAASETSGATGQTSGENSGVASQTSSETSGAARSEAAEALPEDATDRQDSGTEPEHSPITDFSKVDLGLPEGFGLNEELKKSLGKAAVEAGLTPAQVRALAAWNIGAIRERQNSLLEEGRSQLIREWGRKADDNQKAALSLVSRIDRALAENGREGRFSRALAATGADLSADIIAGLYKISGWLAEDSLGASRGAMPEHEESALEGLQDALKRARENI